MREEKIVSRLSEIVALELGICAAKAKQISIAASLHDVGKFRVSDKIINKPGKLTPEEFEQMKLHTKYGAVILSTVQGTLGEIVRKTALYHHEKWAGNGYWNMRLCDLPVYISIIGLCDVYVALRTKRVYKPSWSLGEAVEYIRNNAGTQFNPEIVKIFIELLESGSLDINYCL